MKRGINATALTCRRVLRHQEVVISRLTGINTCRYCANSSAQQTQEDKKQESKTGVGEAKEERLKKILETIKLKRVPLENVIDDPKTQKKDQKATGDEQFVNHARIKARKEAVKASKAFQVGKKGTEIKRIQNELAELCEIALGAKTDTRKPSLLEETSDINDVELEQELEPFESMSKSDSVAQKEALKVEELDEKKRLWDKSRSVPAEKTSVFGLLSDLEERSKSKKKKKKEKWQKDSAKSENSPTNLLKKDLVPNQESQQKTPELKKESSLQEVMESMPASRMTEIVPSLLEEASADIHEVESDQELEPFERNKLRSVPEEESSVFGLLSESEERSESKKKKKKSQNDSAKSENSPTNLLKKDLVPNQESSLRELMESMPVSRMAEVEDDYDERSRKVTSYDNERGYADFTHDFSSAEGMEFVREREFDHSRGRKTSYGQRQDAANVLTSFGNVRLNIFDHRSDLDVQKDMRTQTAWDVLIQKDLSVLFEVPTRNGFEEMIKLTNQGKLWKFPIDNEVGLEEEDNVPFHNHVFLERFCEDFPKHPRIQTFMQVVCVGLSKNYKLTFAKKLAHLQILKQYFEDRVELLKTSAAFEDEQDSQ